MQAPQKFIYDPLRRRSIPLVRPSRPQAAAAVVVRRATSASAPKPPLVVTSMWGIGDNLMQRAVLIELSKSHEVFLVARNIAPLHDLIADGRVKVVSRTAPRIRESLSCPIVAPPQNAPRRRMDYHRPEIKRHGSIPAAMFASMGLKLPGRLDFSVPIPPAWRDKARALIASWNVGERPLVIYRPITINTKWRCDSRSPDPAAYAALFAHTLACFPVRPLVVSIADLAPGKEWVVGTAEQAIDVRLERGELDFETMLALWAEADLAFCNPGFSPVMSHAVGTASITVYGGHEGPQTTNAVSAHLAPSLFIECDNQCDCHEFNHPCDKRITLEPAKVKIAEFIAGEMQKTLRVLIAITSYVDSPHRAKMLDRCLTSTRTLNPDCDILVVDSHSPLCPGVDQLIDAKHGEFIPHPHAAGLRARQMLFSFPDNIGHLSRNNGRDGWGRAFCYALDAAVQGRYDYVLHTEADSLFRLPAMPIARQMQREGTAVYSTPVSGMRIPGSEKGWVETGLMFFSTEFLRESRLTERYEWPKRQKVPTPEVVVRQLCGDKLVMAPWKALRADKNQVTPENVGELDWVTHCWDKEEPYDRFLELALHGKAAQAPAAELPKELRGGEFLPTGSSPASPLKLNLGCGSNKLDGWQNFDAELDIARALPFPDGAAAFIFIEHCVEHVSLYQVIDFLKECWRVLQPGGVLRIAVPSLERIRQLGDDPNYLRLVRRWAPTEGKRGAMHAILYAHGHKTAWTESLLEAVIYFCGFDVTALCRPGQSVHPELVGVEGHGKVIGESNNDLETIVCEGVK